MLATGVSVVSTDVRALPQPKLKPHATIPPGRRVTIAAYGEKFGAKDYLLVRAGDRVGWVLRETIRIDPLLFVDMSHHNGEDPNMKALVNLGVMMIVLKATQSTKYKWAYWYVNNVRHVVEAAGDRFGDTFHLAAYHYFTGKVDGVPQAKYHLNVLKDAYRMPTVRPVVDVEDGADKKTVLKNLRAYCQVIFDQTGQQPILYGGSLLRDLKIKGTEVTNPKPDLWIAEYGPKLKSEMFEPLGYKRSEVAFWQYAGGENSTTPTTPNAGKLPHFNFNGNWIDTNIVLRAKDIADFTKQYGWKR